MQALDRLAKLRAAMENLGIDAVIIPTADPHLSEYVPAHWSLRAALSGFTGSAGMLLVSAEDAALIADSRYWEQAEKQLPAEIALIRLTGSFLDHVTAWCEENLPQGSIVGYDPELVSLNLAEKLRSLLEDLGFEADALAGERSLPLADIWPDRPPLSMSPIRLMKRPGRSIVEKLEAVRSMMADKGAQSVFFSALDDVAWMTNLRGSDVPCNPVFLAYLLVERDSAELFVDAERLSAEAARAIADAGIATVSPSTLHEALAAAALRGQVMLDPDHTNSLLAALVPPESQVRSASPAMMLKCVKSAEEIRAIEEAHLKDAVALAEFYAELDERLAAGDVLTESDAAQMLHAWRAKDPEFFEKSFTTIAAYGPNAALPHYTPPIHGGAVLEPDGLLLIDSGGQYECGTTDITRMTPIGNPSPAMRRDAAIVTRAMLRLLHLKFPAGATGAQIDAAARIDLWAHGLDFGHGTGHGVGYVLNVHEGPVAISPRAQPVAIQPGNVLSDEPGVYRPGRWGIRVENLMVCEQEQTTEFGEFLKFRALTMLPIDVRMFKEPFGEGVELLNAFNAERRNKLMPLVSPRAQKWLSAAAAELPG